MQAFTGSVKTNQYNDLWDTKPLHSRISHLQDIIESKGQITNNLRSNMKRLHKTTLMSVQAIRGSLLVVLVVKI